MAVTNQRQRFSRRGRVRLLRPRPVPVKASPEAPGGAQRQLQGDTFRSGLVSNPRLRFCSQWLVGTTARCHMQFLWALYLLRYFQESYMPGCKTTTPQKVWWSPQVALQKGGEHVAQRVVQQAFQAMLSKPCFPKIHTVQYKKYAVLIPVGVNSMA